MFLFSLFMLEMIWKVVSLGWNSISFYIWQPKPTRCYQWGSFIFCCDDGKFYVVNTYVFPSANVPILSDFLARCLMVFVPKMH
ncbi:unnamed protein product [Ixodes persulcatus]